jgi:uncharacterized repeat protein (TIGR01451 family)
MNTMNTKLGVGLLLLALSLMMAVPGALQAAVSGTTGGVTIENANTAETLPVSAGELSVQFQNVDGTDTNYVDTSTTVTTTVDTGFDIGDISFPTTAQSVSQGETLVVAIPVYNLSNNPGNIPFNVEHLTPTDSTSNDSFSLEFYWEDGNQTSSDFDNGGAGETQLGSGTGTIPFAAGDTKTLYAVVIPDSTALPGDTIQSNLFVTDNAPINGPGSNMNGVTGDQWERGSVISVADSYDTQSDTFVTTLQGSNLKISKSLSLPSGSARPGDTIEYTITAWNDGNQVADTVTLVDAIPDSTSYVVGSATVVDDGGNGDGDHTGESSGAEFGFDNDFDLSNGSANWSSSSDLSANSEGVDPNVATIFWPLDQINTIVNGPGPGVGDQDTIQFTYRVQID